jgi:hypothetical protein
MQVSWLRATVETETRSAAMPQYYEIKVKGHLDPRWSDWFEGLELTDLEGGETMLSGPLADQAALHGLLERIRDLNLTLISVTSGVSLAPISKKEEQGE